MRNGWLHSGDIGMMDYEGYIYIMDRVNDMINAAGFKIWPTEIEQFLYRHTAIKEVAVFGVPDPIVFLIENFTNQIQSGKRRALR